MKAFVSAILRMWIGVTVGLLFAIVALAPAWLLGLAIFYFTVY